MPDSNVQLDLSDLRKVIDDLLDHYLPKNGLSFPIKATWKTKDFDIPVVLTGSKGIIKGERYFSIVGSATCIPEKEIVF